MKTLWVSFPIIRPHTLRARRRKTLPPQISEAEQWLRIETFLTQTAQQTSHLVDIHQAVRQHLDSLGYTVEQLHRDLKPFLLSSPQPSAFSVQTEISVPSPGAKTARRTSKIAA